MTDQSLIALRAEAVEIFDGAETAQAVRDVIEWYDASIRVILAREQEAQPTNEAISNIEKHLNLAPGYLKNALRAAQPAAQEPSTERDEPQGLTDAQCDEFRRLPGAFNDMVRHIYRAGQRVSQEGGKGDTST